MDFSPTKEGYKPRDLNERQKKLLELTWEYGGDTIRAARDAGFSNPYAAVNTMADVLIEEAEKAMARLALKSVMTMEKVLDSDGDVKQANEKLKACQLILDRTNPKTEKVDVNANVKAGLFVLPEKRPVEDPDDAE